MKLHFDDINVRDFHEEDIEHLLNYLYRSPEGYLDELGVDAKKMMPEHKLKELYLLKIKNNKKNNFATATMLTIEHRGRAIGHHAIHLDKKSEHGVFHAHIWNNSDRGKGFGLISYVKALEVFIKRHSLKYVLFETPKHNLSPNRLKEKLGLTPSGEKQINSPHGITKPGIVAWTYKLDKEELPEVKKRVLQLLA